MENQPQEQPKKNWFTKTKIVKLVIWVVVGVLVGIFCSSIYTYSDSEEEYIDNLYKGSIWTRGVDTISTCISVHHYGFPLDVDVTYIKDWFHLQISYNSIPPAYAQVKYEPEGQIIFAGCVVGPFNTKNFYINILVYVLFFVMVEILITKKRHYWLYILNPLFVLALYLLFS